MAKLLVNQPATGGELDPASLFCSCCSQRFSSAAKASEVELEVSSRSKHLLQLWGTNSPGLRPQNKKSGPPKHFPSLNPHRSRGNLLFYLFGSLVPTRVRVKMDIYSQIAILIWKMRFESINFWSFPNPDKKQITLLIIS